VPTFWSFAKGDWTTHVQHRRFLWRIAENARDWHSGGHGFTDGGKTGACVQHRGRAALQGRETLGISAGFSRCDNDLSRRRVFRSQSSRAVSEPDQVHGAPTGARHFQLDLSQTQKG